MSEAAIPVGSYAPIEGGFGLVVPSKSIVIPASPLCPFKQEVLW